MARRWNNQFARKRGWPTILFASLAAILITIATAALEDAAGPGCGASLQSMVDSATPGAVVEVPACVYREETIIDKPITLDASPGAEIRGSDVWRGWEKSGAYWTKGTLPTFEAHGKCASDTGRCLWPEQVFFDGEPLEQVASNPASGQFAVDADRNVVLADDPAGHAVEVTTRVGWLMGRSADVTIRGFTMKHAANDSQNGAIENNGHSRWTLLDNELSDAHGAVVSLTEGTDLKLVGNQIHRGGQLGVHASEGEFLLRGNEIHHNNTEGFDAGWEAGGVKTSGVQSLLADGNKVYHNGGVGLWCDIGCTDATYSNNRVHHNEMMGISFEIGSGAEIFGNVVWENGWGEPAWGWGAGILSSSSKNVEIRDNVVAWNADGISVISADREGTEHDEVTNVQVHHNIILAEDNPAARHTRFSLGWLQDWAGVLFVPASGNRGYDNEYWYPSPQGSLVRFSWSGKDMDKMAYFNATPGEERGRYLTGAEKDRVVSSAGIPSSPEPH